MRIEYAFHDVHLYFRNEGFISFDITDIVNSWDQGSANHGILVRATNQNVVGTVIRFYSDDSSNANHHAYIDVNCT